MPFGSWSDYAFAAPPQVPLVVVFFMFLVQEHYFLPCGFDINEVVPIKACLES
jgi:hypothetical protein